MTNESEIRKTSPVHRRPLSKDPDAISKIKQMWEDGERNRGNIARTINYPYRSVDLVINQLIEEGALGPGEPKNPKNSEKLSDSVRESVDRLASAEPGDVQNIAAAEIELLFKYYDSVLGQSRRSFHLALIGAGVSLVFFLAAVSFLLILESENLAMISIIGGVLIEVISGIIFYLYNKSTSQLSEFHEKLESTQRFLLVNSIKTQKFILANEMCEGLEENIKQKTRSELIKSMVKVPIRSENTLQNSEDSMK